MEHSLSSEANSRSASQEITRLLRNPKTPQQVPILSQMHSVHT